MRKLRLLLFLFQLLIYTECSMKEKEVGGESWLNIKYVECLKNMLPCECEKFTQEYFSLSLDTNPESKSYGIALSKFEQMEPFTYRIKRTGSNEYVIYKSQQDSSTWARISIKDEELQLIGSENTFKFTKGISNGYDPQHYLSDNVSLINKAFVSRGFPKLEKILDANNLKCDCNKWMGKVNMVYVKGEPKAWVMEIIGDSLKISRITNAERDPEDPVKLEELVKFKWN